MNPDELTLKELADGVDNPSMSVELRAMSDLLQRYRFAKAAGLTFNGNRDVSRVLGYLDVIKISDYRERYRRNPIAARIIEAKPQSTWRGGAELIEDQNPDKLTDFEQDWMDLDESVGIWKHFHQVDLLAGFGEYAILVIGCPGDFKSEIPTLGSINKIWYLKVYAQDEAKIDSYVESTSDRRFGQPLRYQLTGSRRKFKTGTSGIFPQTIHWSRAIHVADGAVEDDIFGQPRLERAWNRLDDLDKVVGGGSEAFWIRANQGMHINKDPTVPVDKTGQADKKLQEEIDEYVHGLNRFIRTRGIDINMLGSDVASFGPSADAIIAQLAAGTGIPQRILMGSERGHLASTQDKDNWDEQIHDRRTQYAGPMIVDPFANRMIKAKVVREPKQYEIRWPEMKSLDDSQKAEVALIIAKANKENGTPIWTVGEIRDKIFGMGPIDESEVEKQIDQMTSALPKAAKQLLRKRIALGITKKKEDQKVTVPLRLVENL